MATFMKFVSPIDGDMLNGRDGSLEAGVLSTVVTLAADEGRSITINGVPADEHAGIYTAMIDLDAYQNTIQAVDTESGDSQSIIVYLLTRYAGKYRVSVDDGVWFLRDIAENDYPTIFANPYLNMWKQFHDTYGTKVHINIYFEDVWEDNSGWTIEQVPDRYRSEWEAHSDWLHLSFHAKHDQPGFPYANSGYDELYRDAKQVQEQILRFAGEKQVGPTTTLHYSDTTREGCRALRDLGRKILVGDINVDCDKPALAYYLDVTMRRHLNKRFIWKDHQEDIIFFRSAIITDTYPLKDIVPFLDSVKADPHKSAYMDFLIHEQYFYPRFRELYQPNYREKVQTVIQWALDNGYESAHLEDVVLEK